MAQVSDSLLKANHGVARVMGELSWFSLIRPVAEGTDIGVDLFCELVEGNEPFLHFWLQVKAGKIDLDSDGRARYPFETAHLKYWQRQPVPVFAFLVPVEWPPTKESIYPLYVVNITDQLLQIASLETATRTLHSDHAVNSRRELEKIMRKIVPWTAALQRLPQGSAVIIPTLAPAYEQHVPVGRSHAYAGPALLQIRLTAAITVQDLVQQREEKGTKPGTIFITGSFWQGFWKPLEIMRSGKFRSVSAYQPGLTRRWTRLLNGLIGRWG